MKKIFILFTLLLYFTIHASAQEIQGLAQYSTKLAEDHFVFNAQLAFNDSKSIYAVKQKNISEWKIRGSGDNGDEISYNSQKVYTDTTGHVIINEINKNYLIVRDFCTENRPVIYKDTVKLYWEITDKTKKINGLKCTLAKTDFRGRKYNVWFTFSIPVPFGPWKFHGLPGLIIEIRDNKNEVFMQLESLNLKSKPTMELNLTGKKTTLKNITECKNKEWEKNTARQEAFFSQLRADNPDMEIEISVPDSRPATELEFEWE